MLHVSSWKETSSEAPFQNVIIVIKFEKFYSTATEKHCTEIQKNRDYYLLRGGYNSTGRIFLDPK